MLAPVRPVIAERTLAALVVKQARDISGSLEFLRLTVESGRGYAARDQFVAQVIDYSPPFN